MGTSPITPLCANNRTLSQNGCVFAIVSAPFVACRTCHEGSRTYLARLGSEPAILERGDRLLVDAGCAVRIEIADAGAVGILMALDAQAVSRSEQPKRRPDGLVARAHPEQSTHPREPYVTSAERSPRLRSPPRRRSGRRSRCEAV